jgi:hypothetical protein
MDRVGQNRIYTPCMTIYFLIYLPIIPYIHRIYMVLANLTYGASWHMEQIAHLNVPLYR